MQIKIRTETPDDHNAVNELTREAFWKFWEPDRVICDEHLLVHKLRKVKAFVPELSFVAEIDGDYSNVVGLPLCNVALLLKKFGIKTL